MRIIVAGSRTFEDYEKLEHVLNQFNSVKPITELVCGMAKGADMMGYWWAEQHSVPVREFPANWAKFGKRAGYVRNAEMAKNADGLIAFWDKKSKGTEHMINLAMKAGILVDINYI